MCTWEMCREAELSPEAASRWEEKPAAEKKGEEAGVRVFISVNLEEELVEKFYKKVEELKRHAVRGKFPHPENMHITVVFIGNTGNVEAVKQAMDNIKARPFELKFRKVGKFVRQGRETYYVSLKRNAALKYINHQLTESLSHAGFELDKREYTPHLTLGRNLVFDLDFDLEEFSKSVAEMKARMKVMKISLMKSERVEGKQKYTEIHHIDLYDE